jgi:hypothetical protein
MRRFADLFCIVILKNESLAVNRPYRALPAYHESSVESDVRRKGPLRLCRGHTPDG